MSGRVRAVGGVCALGGTLAAQDFGGGTELVLDGLGLGAKAGLGLLEAAGDGCKRSGSGFGAMGGGGGFTLGLGATGGFFTPREYRGRERERNIKKKKERATQMKR